MGITQKQIMIGGGLLLGAGLVYFFGRGVKGVAQDTTRAAVNVAGGVVQGTVNGVSDVLGVPVPTRDTCDAAKASGSSWEVSKHCPAGEFFDYLVDGDTVTDQGEGWNSYDQDALRAQGMSGN